MRRHATTLPRQQRFSDPLVPPELVAPSIDTTLASHVAEHGGLTLNVLENPEGGTTKVRLAGSPGPEKSTVTECEPPEPPVSTR
jgi:hypothetical protein